MTAEEALKSKKFHAATEELLRIGMDDEQGCTMFSTADVHLSKKEKKIIIELTPNKFFVVKEEDRRDT